MALTPAPLLPCTPYCPVCPSHPMMIPIPSPCYSPHLLGGEVACIAGVSPLVVANVCGVGIGHSRGIAADADCLDVEPLVGAHAGVAKDMIGGGHLAAGGANATGLCDVRGATGMADACGVCPAAACRGRKERHSGAKQAGQASKAVDTRICEEKCNASVRTKLPPCSASTLLPQ